MAVEWKKLALTPHASDHQAGGPDAIKLDDLAAPDDNVDLNASITKHGLLKKLDNDDTHFMNGKGNWTSPGTGTLLSIPPTAFIPVTDTQDWVHGISLLRNRAALTAQTFVAPVYFPDGVTVSAVSLYGYRDDASAVMRLKLYRLTVAAGGVIMADITADWTIGYSGKTDAGIVSPIIDNVNYHYGLLLSLDPNNSVADIHLTGVKIVFA